MQLLRTQGHVTGMQHAAVQHGLGVGLGTQSASAAHAYQHVLHRTDTVRWSGWYMRQRGAQVSHGERKDLGDTCSTAALVPCYIAC